MYRCRGQPQFRLWGLIYRRLVLRDRQISEWVLAGYRWRGKVWCHNFYYHWFGTVIARIPFWDGTGGLFSRSVLFMFAVSSHLTVRGLYDYGPWIFVLLDYHALYTQVGNPYGPITKWQLLSLHYFVSVVIISLSQGSLSFLRMWSSQSAGVFGFSSSG